MATDGVPGSMEGALAVHITAADEAVFRTGAEDIQTATSGTALPTRQALCPTFPRDRQH